MNEKTFKREMMMADCMKSENPDYYAGYRRGLRRKYHGEKFGTESEHNQWMNCADGEHRKQTQAGYRAGFNFKQTLDKK